MKVVICEKYNQADVVADTICDDPDEEKMRGEPLWRGDNVFVVPMSGQVWELEELESRSSYPDFPELGWEIKDRFTGKRDLLEDLLTSPDEVVLAGDYDREGELISTLSLLIPKWGDPDWGYIEDWDVPVSRMRYSSMVPHEIQDAWDNRSPPDRNLWEAGLARAIIDYRVGINISRALSQCVLRGAGEWHSLSAGRVQTPLLDLIRDRTQEHRAHDPEPYWIPEIELSSSD